MGLSTFIIQQREKEAEALKTFLCYSLMASVALHIGVLALSINRFFLRVPEVREEPIEVTILETVPQKVVEPLVKTKLLPKINSDAGGGNQGGGISIPTKTDVSIIKSSVAPVTKQNPPKTSNNFITKQSQILTSPEPRTAPKPVKINPTENTSSEPTIRTNPVKTNPIEKLDENSNNLASTPPQANTKTADIPHNSTTSTQLPQNINSLNNLGDRLGNNLDKGTGVGKGSGNGVSTGVGKGSGNGVGNEIGNKQKPENTPVATATKPPKENGSTLNRADCIQCKIKYPDSARRRGAEGNPEVSINTDLNGNVTQVRLIRSSGDRELDEAAQKAAQEWKLTPTEGGREGVKASVNFAIKGTQRHRQLQERQTKKEREVAKKKPEKETFTSNSVESSQGNQRKITPIITDVPTENTIRRNPESAPSESKSSTESNSDL